MRGGSMTLGFAAFAILFAACSGGDDSAPSNPSADAGVYGHGHDAGFGIADASSTDDDGGSTINAVCSAVKPDAGTTYPDAVAIEGGGQSFSLVEVNGVLYWSSYEGVVSCTLDDSRTICVDEQDIYGKSTSEGVLATDGHLLYYATEATGITSIDLTGAGATSILAGPLAFAPSTMVVAGGKIFWATPSSGIQACTISNCAATSAPIDPLDGFAGGSLGMTTDGTHLYWNYYSDVYVSGLDGSNAQLFASVSPQPAGMFVDACNLYWGSYSDTQSLSACALSDCANTITPLAHVAQGYAFGVTANPSEIFFSNHLAGHVYRVALSP